MAFPLEKKFEENFSTESTKHQRYAGGAKIVATGYPEGRNEKRQVLVETTILLHVSLEPHGHPCITGCLSIG